MGKVDILTKNYMGDAEVFADAFNYYIYGGRPAIDPARLKTLDPEQLGVLHGREGAAGLIQKYRDLFKQACFMEDGRAVYLLLGIENHTGVHYARTDGTGLCPCMRCCPWRIPGSCRWYRIIRCI